MRDDVRKNLTEQPKPTAREVLRPVVEFMPLGERLDPILVEILWVLMGKLRCTTKHSDKVSQLLMPRRSNLKR